MVSMDIIVEEILKLHVPKTCQLESSRVISMMASSSRKHQNEEIYLSERLLLKECGMNSNEVLAKAIQGRVTPGVLRWNNANHQSYALCRNWCE